jgi:hypothetical protein
MRPWILVAVLFSLGLGLIGCSDESEPAPSAPANATAKKPSPPPTPPPPPPAPSSTEKSEAVEKNPLANPFLQGASTSPATPGSQGASPMNAASPFAWMNGAAAERPAANRSANFTSNSPGVAAKIWAPGAEQVKLSAGVALPQTGPEGILMSFSVDYELLVAPSKAPYVWVIERGQGVSAKIPVKLAKKQGNLVTLIQGWRPTDGPFQSHLEDKTGKQVSASVELLGQN